MTQALTLSSIAHLLVVLSVAQKTMARSAHDGSAMQPIPMLRIDTVVDESLMQCFRQLLERTEIFVIAFRLACENSVQRMMEIIAPLRVHTQSASVGAGHNTWIVQIALGNQNQLSAELGGKCV